MARKFNTEGQCNPNIHYMVRAMKRINITARGILLPGSESKWRFPRSR